MLHSLRPDHPIEPGPSASAGLKQMAFGELIALLRLRGHAMPDAMLIARDWTGCAPFDYAGETQEDYCRLAMRGLAYAPPGKRLVLTPKGYAWIRAMQHTRNL